MTPPTARSGTVIYDFGANNGDDVPYYLLKAETVVAVEANPQLADEIAARFADEIRTGRVIVENCVLTADPATGPVPFYLHRTNPVLSQFPAPTPSVMDQFTQQTFPARYVNDLFRDHGEPYYVKVDLEHYDAVILAAMFRGGFFPPFISTEVQSIDAFCVLVASARYRAFKLVDGHTVSERFRDHVIQCSQGEAHYSFPHHSAGPFGNDIPGPWLDTENMFRFLAVQHIGWKDLHATRVEQPDPLYMPSVGLQALMRFIRKSLMPSTFRRRARQRSALTLSDVSR